MQLRQAIRKAAKLRVSFSAVSGAGKTYGALLTAHGMTKDWSKIAIIDTENGSADLYAHLGKYQVLTLQAPFTPERYIQAITACEQAGMEVIIIDSLAHAWSYLLSVHASMSGNSYTNWKDITPRYDALINKILQSSAHIFVTVRRKTEYEMNQVNGKTTISKLGTKEQVRDGLDYEMTLVLEIDENHMAKATKDRTEIFVNSDPFKISTETGELLRQWADSGESDTEILLQAGLAELNNTSNMVQLTNVWNKFSELKTNETFKEAVKTKKASLSPATAK